MNIAIYTSAHGYGHASRSHEVARVLVELDKNCRVHFMSTVPDSFFAEETRSGIIYRSCKLDVGMRQIDSLNMDLPGTLQDLDDLMHRSDDLIDRETSFLRKESIDIVLADLPFLAFEAAAEAGVSSWGMSNFSWDWIYEYYLDELPDIMPHIDRIRSAYKLAEGLFRLPFVGGLDYFSNPVDVPLLARQSKLGKSEIRARLQLSQDDPVILFSFGGIRQEINARAGIENSVILLTSDPSPDPGKPFAHISDSRLKETGLRYCDLVSAADAVISKPGYGIVSECIANRTALIYTPRGKFREYPVLAKAVKEHLPSMEIPAEALSGDIWLQIALQVIEQPFPARPDCSGAEVIAKNLLASLHLE